MWKKVSVWALAIMSIFTLTFPAIALYVVDTYQIDTIQHEIEENGVAAIGSGIYHNTNPDGQNLTQQEYLDLQWSMGSIFGKLWITNEGDTFTHKTGTLQWDKKDNLTIIDNTNYALHDDYKTPAITGTHVFYWTNLTNYYVANNLDALIINWTATHGEWGVHFVLGTGSGTTSNIQLSDKSKVDNDTYVFILTPSLKAQLLTQIDNRVWLYATNLNHSDLDYSWSIEEADTSGIFSIQPLVLTQIIFLFIVVIMGIFTLFATDTIDIKIDR